ncbi:MAG: hypothetical protein EPN93_21250 [Spirochaetes bacterium]|nr:MAG: hypothetical protein EPN93_21250 [Spirochaetota bacterium]
MLHIILVLTLFSLVAAYFYYMDFRYLLNRRTARKDLAITAKMLGLKRKGGGDLGTYEGRIDGYFVKITADERTKITIMLKSKCDVWLFRTSWMEKIINRSSMKDPFPGSVPFMFGNGDANGIFHYQYASKRVAEALCRADASLRLLGGLARQWRWTMGPMSLIYGQISASPSRGMGHKCHSITGRQLKEYLPGLIALAKVWDSLPELIGERQRLENNV